VRYSTVLFVFDGTLVDSGAMILASFRHATRTVLGREIPDEELISAAGGTSVTEQMRSFDADRTPELVAVYRDHHELLHEDGLAVFGGMDDVLERLHGEGRKLGIVTAKRRRSIDLAFQSVDLARFFGAIVTADDAARHKPDPEPVYVALERLGSRPEDTAFVGDSPFDMGAGKAAGVYAVGVSCGGLHREERLREAGADVVVHSTEELLGVL
jgi:pyrophosphatase PpaX